ncbi:Wzz/FepE/Etk N-terminal domain-containing protein [Desulfovibrio mangrovi]|uniref:XrtA system polysaccharide chain length determinant n=1 Tax=Desulfovibrio mangrovi TaxID=2976983 RepID=UPI0022457437|nr:XrtA system polysaccharide chain length determinant [Desulfovibrio mangrovi]UZP67543.1 Wzz/FepE/Etk N-terminal domain-containing protein [Desulfovibrio mangrovi]
MQGLDHSRHVVKRIVKLLVDRIVLISAILFAFVLGAVVLSYSLPKRYEARGTVYIEQSVINDLVRGIAITPSMSAKIKVLNVTMLSRAMLLEVIRELDMDVNADSEPALDTLINTVRSKVEISLNESKGLFFISYVDEDPARARDFVNTLIRRYIEESTTSKREEAFEATRFLADQIELFRKRIEQAQVDIDDYLSRNGKALNANEQILRQEIEMAEAKLQGLRIRKNELVAKRSLLVRNTPLRKRLEDLEAGRTSLLVNYTENHPRVRRVQEEIVAVKHEISRNGESEKRAVYGTAEYQETRVELEAIAQIERGLERQIVDGTDQLRRIPAMRSELQELERKKKKESIIYEQLVARYGQSEVSKQMELQDKAVSFRVIDPATLPVYPISPNRVLILLAGLFLGIGGGTGLVLLLDFLDGRVKAYHELERFGIPIMVVVPDIDSLKNDDGLLREHWRTLSVLGGILALFIGMVVIEAQQLTYIEDAVNTLVRMVSNIV